MAKKIKRHKYTGTGTTNGVDQYPDIDCFIPYAEQVAETAFPDKTIEHYDKKWSTLFHQTMDTELVKAGLRVK